MRRTNSTATRSPFATWVSSTGEARPSIPITSHRAWWSNRSRGTPRSCSFAPATKYVGIVGQTSPPTAQHLELSGTGAPIQPSAVTRRAPADVSAELRYPTDQEAQGLHRPYTQVPDIGISLLSAIPRANFSDEEFRDLRLGYSRTKMDDKRHLDRMVAALPNFWGTTHCSLSRPAVAPSPCDWQTASWSVPQRVTMVRFTEGGEIPVLRWHCSDYIWTVGKLWMAEQFTCCEMKEFLL